MYPLKVVECVPTSGMIKPHTYQQQQSTIFNSIMLYSIMCVSIVDIVVIVITKHIHTVVYTLQ